MELTTGLIIGASVVGFVWAVIALFNRKPRYKLHDYRAYCFECQCYTRVKEDLRTGTLFCPQCKLIHIVEKE